VSDEFLLGSRRGDGSTAIFVADDKGEVHMETEIVTDPTRSSWR
jgi:hypothetical protein